MTVIINCELNRWRCRHENSWIAVPVTQFPIHPIVLLPLIGVINLHKQLNRSIEPEKSHPTMELLMCLRCDSWWRKVCHRGGSSTPTRHGNQGTSLRYFHHTTHETGITPTSQFEVPPDTQRRLVIRLPRLTNSKRHEFTLIFIPLLSAELVKKNDTQSTGQNK